MRSPGLTLTAAALVVLAALLASPVAADLSSPVAAAIPPAGAARPAGISSAGTSTILIQNMDASQDATVVLDFYQQGTGNLTSINMPTLGAGAVQSVYASSQNVANGAYSVIGSSDRDIGLVSSIEWPASGGAVLFNQCEPSTDVVVPLVTKQHLNQDSLISIQNTDPSSQATVQLSLYASGDSTPVQQVQLAIMPGTSITVDMLKSAQFVTIPPGFIGTMRVESATPMAVLAIGDHAASQKAVYAFEGVPAGSAADVLHAPVVYAGGALDPTDPAPELADTRIAVANAGSASADVTVTYTGVAGSCAGQQFTHGPYTVGANTNAVFDQAPGSSTYPTGASGLPEGCTAIAEIAAPSSQLVATVVGGVRGATTKYAFAYSALPASSAGTKVHLPRVRRAHEELTAGITVLNPGSAAASASLALFDNTGASVPCNPADCAASIPAGGAHNWWLGSLGGVPDNLLGWADVESDQPLLGTVVVAPLAGANGWDAASYVGLVPTGAGMMDAEFVPITLVETGGVVPTSGPPPTATPPLPPTAAPTPTPVQPPTATAVQPPTATPLPTDTPLPTNTPLPTATAVPPTATAGPSGAPKVDPWITNRVPGAAVTAALAAPDKVEGWGRLMNPSVPYHPLYNPYRTCLTLNNPGVPYHPTYNGLVFKAGCR